MVDHVIPHLGDMQIFWKRDDWQSLCDECNQEIKQPLELAFKDGRISAEQLRLDRQMPDIFIPEP